mgnify:CR=1 FL=1|tara:strand:+ start:88 stop:552 length:465 start_codon:yes stop_codon:yes gene_type:complete
MINKATFVCAALAIATALPAFAGTVNAKVEDRYKKISVNEPRNKQDCVMVNIPVYGQTTKQANGADALIGGILGGVIGNQMGNGSGKDIMTGLGAIFGATQLSKPRTETVVTGYTQERQCTMVTNYVSVTKTVYDYSVITWTQDGVEYSTKFVK